MLANLQRKDFERLAQIVREETGNQVQEKNYAMLESRMRSYVLRLGFQDMEAYWKHFESHELNEREVLRGLMTTHYTFFFREYVHFEFLEKWIQSELPRLKARQTPVRIWSAACSRGQEVYSLAMFLELNLTQKHGLNYEIYGTDIDPESVQFAKNGVYPIKEVNTIAQNYLTFWKKGTGPIKEFAAIHPSIKGKTQFGVLNLLKKGDWVQQKFDVIFCRNVFIYFAEDKVKQVAFDLGSTLNENGLLISGLSEPLRYNDWKLANVGPAVYQNATVSAQAPKAAPTAAAPSKVAPTPAHSVNPAPMPPPLLAQATEEPYRVLCVDDSPTIQLLIKKIFSKDPLCANVDVAGNGKIAREMLDKNKYQLITLDIHMPEVNGIEFMERLYKKKIDPPVLMVSSVNRTDVDLATKALSLGAFDYVEKPAMNSLQKSAEEILVKAKLAMRKGAASTEDGAVEFNTSIAQKIVVPDASQCLRVVLAASDSVSQLEQVIRGQSAEYRSPALLVVCKDKGQSSPLAGQILNWTQRTVGTLRGNETLLKPNHVYTIDVADCDPLMGNLKFKTISLQVLSRVTLPARSFPGAQSVQVLVDEPLLSSVGAIEREVHKPVSDVTPATSFPSLSVEYFANLRKAAA